jgi:predicted nucleic-acid-binding Zn-ribbon protein
LSEQIKFTELKCDSCDYIEHTESVTIDTCIKYLNTPCPKCGANLFTKEDYDTLLRINKILKIQNVLEKIFSFFHITPKKVKVKVDMKGDGSIKIEEVNNK